MQRRIARDSVNRRLRRRGSQYAVVVAGRNATSTGIFHKAETKLDLKNLLRHLKPSPLRL
jgi:hypothetical protein